MIHNRCKFLISVELKAKSQCRKTLYDNENYLSFCLGYPTVQTNQTTVTGFESSSFSLNCFYDGYPEVTSVVWIKNSRRIIMDTVMSDGMATIMISNAKLGDSGNYSCNVSNTQGATESSNITVEIIKGTLHKELVSQKVMFECFESEVIFYIDHY